MFITRWFTNSTNTSQGSRQSSANTKNAKSNAVHIPVDSSAVKSPGRLADKQAPEGEGFHIHNGPTVYTVGELAEYLRSASETVFEHHVGEGYNDFACWIMDVFEDPAAAEVVASARNPSEIVYILDSLS